MANDLHAALLEAIRYAELDDIVSDRFARALRAVVELHRPNKHGDCVACQVGCHEYELHEIEWPCETIKSIAASLGVETGDELGDPYPTCCSEGCRCGQPGDATLSKDALGTVTVVHADPVIRVSRAFLDTLADEGSQHWDPDTMVLTLDTAGAYRYGYLRPDPKDCEMAIFGRLRDG